MRLKVWANLYDDLYADPLLDGLTQAGFEVVRLHVDKNDRPALLKAAKGFDYVIASLEMWDKELIDAAGPQLKLLIKYGTGVNNFDIPYATQKGIAIANLAGQNAPAVAQLALTHILSCQRRYAYTCSLARQKVWQPYTGNELDGKTLGLVGFGQIAQNLARMVSGFTTQVLAYDVFKNEEALKAHPNVTFQPDLKKLLAVSDIISVHVPLLEQTRRMMNAELFSCMKDGVVFVNTSRGEIVDEKALMDALQSGKVSAAGLDVTSSEPFDPNNPLLAMDQVSVTPHIGAATLESEDRCQHLMVEIARTFAQGKPHARVINPEFALNR
jgi:phosphoglycerate dehydrogenase-like enzyme